MSDDDELFEELSTPAIESYGAIHEMFSTLQKAGFTENQALRYVVLWTIEIGRSAPPDEDEVGGL